MSYIMKAAATGLCAAIIFGILTSCGESVTKPSSDSIDEIQVTADTGEAVETNQFGSPIINDGLPDDLDFEGIDIRILHRSDGDQLDLEIFADDESGDVVETAVYRRNQKIEERLNVRIKETSIAATIHDGDTVANVVRKSVQSGSDDYDLCVNHMSGSVILILEGMCRNLNQLPYLDFDRPWWVKDFIDNVTVYGKCYIMAGDIGLSMIESEYLMYYNKVLYGNYFGDSLYDLIDSGGWTIDKLSEMCETAYSDLNGNSTADKEDQYGYGSTALRFVDGLLCSCDVKLTEKDENGEPCFVIEQNPRTFEFVEKVNSLFYDSNRSLMFQDSEKGDREISDVFAAGRLMFIPNTMMGAAYLRDMKDDFGVIPMVKLNEEQPDYTAGVHNGFSAWLMLTTTPHANENAAFCEAMCAESYNTVTQAYYEVALKEKYSRDEETRRMLDLIRASLKFDFGYVNSGMLDSVMQQFRDLVKAKPDKVASNMAKKMTSCQKALEKFLDTYKELG